MKTQGGFVSTGILIAIVLGLIVVGSAYFVIQQNSTSQTVSENKFLPDNALPTKNTVSNQSSNTQPVPVTPKSQNSLIYSKTYTNGDFGISFSHPDNWQCKTYKTNSAHPNWFQTVCEHDGVWENDPNVAISVPFVAENHELWIKVREATITGQNSSRIKKTIYRSAGFGGSIGMVEYIFSDSASAKSYNAYTLYGSGKPYKNVEEAESVLDAVVKTILIASQTNPISQSASDLKTYTNAQYGFSFQYPQDMSVQTSGYVSIRAISTESPVAYMRIDDSSQTEGYITFNITSLTNCEPGASPANASINGANFWRSDNGQADTGGFERHYVGLKKMCYIIQLTSFPSTCVNSGCENRQWTATTMENVLNRLDTIAQTFRFTQ